MKGCSKKEPKKLGDYSVGMWGPHLNMDGPTLIVHTYGMKTKGHEQLVRYILKTKLTAAQLASRAGLHYMQVRHLVHGRRRASLDVAMALESATRGAVSAKAWTEVA